MSTASDCYIPVKVGEGASLSWEDAGEICEELNGTLAAIENDQTMFEVSQSGK